MTTSPLSPVSCFTICSNNYIFKALVLAASLKKHTDCPVYLFLADVPDEKIAYSELGFTRVIFPEELPICNLQWMKEHYSVVELNTALKAFAFQYLLAHTDRELIYYFDPDIAVYQPLSSFEAFWGDHAILLTPHILSPIPLDGKFPSENLFLNHGLYNLGFLGLRRGGTTSRFLEWWSGRLAEHCLIDLREGYFVDQLWLNLAPTLFGSTGIIRHHGCNMAYWNLHERDLSFTAGQYVVNGTEPLVFYHFSSFDAGLAHIHRLPNFRYGFEGREPLFRLYREYGAALKENAPEFYQGFPYFNGIYPRVTPPPSMTSRIVRKLKSFFK